MAEAARALPPRSAADIRYSVFVFIAVAALLFLIQGNRFVLTNDEGILLEPAQRLAAGARPYVDFFGYMSPGSYWIQGALFRLLGTSLWVGRIPVIVDLSLQSALVFWLVARLASVRAAAATVVVFVGFQIADPSFLTAQHRWDSATLALAGLCCAIACHKIFPEVDSIYGAAPLSRAGRSRPASSVATRRADEGVGRGRRRPPHKNRVALGMMASGAFLAAAAICTPSVALVSAAEAVWLLIARDRRRSLLPFLTGAAAVALLAAGALLLTGTFRAFVTQMLWLGRNYTTVNLMPYGSVIGGYGRLFEGAAGVEFVLRALLVLCLALPAILPPLAMALWSVLAVRRDVAVRTNAGSEVLLLALATAAFVASVFPRADLMHLAFVAALPYVLVAIALTRLLTARPGAILAFTMMPLAVLFSLNAIAGSWKARSVSMPAGSVRASADIAPELAKLVSSVQPGQKLFVYPYMPVLYFVTQTRNPTRFAFLAPGLMTETDESTVRSELEAHPPEWLMYMELTRQEFLRVFPNAAALNQSFPRLEKWLQANYRVETGATAVNIGGYRLWRRAAGPGADLSATFSP